MNERAHFLYGILVNENVTNFVLFAVQQDGIWRINSKVHHVACDDHLVELDLGNYNVRRERKMCYYIYSRKKVR